MISHATDEQETGNNEQSNKLAYRLYKYDFLLISNT